jgi:hypothetical protein
MRFKPRVFVAMSFEPRFQERYDSVIVPAVQSISSAGRPLDAFRVDASKSGDSILTEILDGVAHSELVLADLSVVGQDAATGHAYRNGNVMYEVGLALACRQPSEVLLLRDDHERFLFDVSTIPHLTVDFHDQEAARKCIANELTARISTRKLLEDARIEIAIATLSREEVDALQNMAQFKPGQFWGRIPSKSGLDLMGMVMIPRLLDKGIIKLAGVSQAGYPVYLPTPFGHAIAGHIAGLDPVAGSEDGFERS